MSSVTTISVTYFTFHFLYNSSKNYIIHCKNTNTSLKTKNINIISIRVTYEGWKFNSGNYLFTTDTKQIHVSKFYCPSV